MIGKFIREFLQSKDSSPGPTKPNTYCVPVVTESKKTKENSFQEVLKNEILHDTNATEGVVRIPIGRIKPNPHQPRHYFDEESIKGLAQSIKGKGLLQPIIVRTTSSQEADYELIAGERRLKAVIMLGWKTIPSILKNDISPSDLRALALIENLQREDLPIIDKAKGFYELKRELGDVTTTAEILSVSEKTVDRYSKIARTCVEIPEIEEIIRSKNLDFRESFRICGLGDNLAKLKEGDPEKFSKMIRRLREGEKTSSNVVIKMKKRNIGSKKVQKSEKLECKNFWCSNVQFGLNLIIDRMDATKPSVREFAKEEINKFLMAIGFKHVNIE